VSSPATTGRQGDPNRQQAQACPCRRAPHARACSMLSLGSTICWPHRQAIAGGWRRPRPAQAAPPTCLHDATGPFGGPWPTGPRGVSACGGSGVGGCCCWWDPRRHRPPAWPAAQPRRSALLSIRLVTPSTSAVCSSLRPFSPWAAVAGAKPGCARLFGRLPAAVDQAEVDVLGSPTTTATVWLPGVGDEAAQPGARHNISSPTTNPYGAGSSPGG